MNKKTKNNYKIAVIGLGYVGLPLAIELSKYNEVFGYDINLKRVNEIRRGIDSSKELKNNQIASLYAFNATNNPKDIINKDNHEIKKWAHKIIMKPNEILFIPTNWLYIQEINDYCFQFHIDIDSSIQAVIE